MSLVGKSGRFEIGGEMAVHRLGYGALHLLEVGPDAFGPPAPGVDWHAMLRRVVDAGINLIDTADVYGPETNEQMLAEALHPYAGDLVISTKGGLVRTAPGELTTDYSAAHLRAAIEGSLRRLKRECLDLWTVHHVDETAPIEEMVDFLSGMRREGKIRHVGLAKASVEQLDRARAIMPIAMVQTRYNVADRRADPVVRYCEQHGIGFMAYFPLAGGYVDRLRACVEEVAASRGVSIQRVALAWILQRSHAIIPIPGTGRMEELDDNLAACGLDLTPAEIRLIDQRHDALPPIVDGPTPIRSKTPD